MRHGQVEIRLGVFGNKLDRLVEVGKRIVKPLPANIQHAAIRQAHVLRHRARVLTQDLIKVRLRRNEVGLAQPRLFLLESHFAGGETAEKLRPMEVLLQVQAGRQLGAGIRPLPQAELAQAGDVMRPVIVGMLLEHQRTRFDRVDPAILPVRFHAGQKPVESPSCLGRIQVGCVPVKRSAVALSQEAGLVAMEGAHRTTGAVAQPGRQRQQLQGPVGAGPACLGRVDGTRRGGCLGVGPDQQQLIAIADQAGILGGVEIPAVAIENGGRAVDVVREPVDGGKLPGLRPALGPVLNGVQAGGDGGVEQGLVARLQNTLQTLLARFPSSSSLSRWSRDARRCSTSSRN